jgi:hypothetical protein
MPRDLQPYRNQDGSFDLTFYKARAARLRQKAIAEFMGTMFGRAVDWIGRVRHSGNQSRFWVHNVWSRRRRSGAHDSRA